ncbi:MAG: SagB/ThcOx family dehydrogenase [Bacteroidales bacterium]|jgi:nitroreductase|nr:SagB/ThcOx family dehydrogenase [Bacteroidales bacterium]
MKNKMLITCILVAVSQFLGSVNAQDITLPEPHRTGGMPLMQALNERHSTRTFTNENLSQQQLSDLMWAAWGYNRKDENKRTAPSSRDFQEIDVYVSMASGLYVYDAAKHILKQVHNKDIRALCGTQDFVATAPLNIVYVADMVKTGKKEGDAITDTDLLSSWANTGLIAQNVYLFCASEKLGCVIRGLIPKEKLAPEMGLRPTQFIILSQTIGVPVI